MTMYAVCTLCLVTRASCPESKSYPNENQIFYELASLFSVTLGLYLVCSDLDQCDGWDINVDARQI